MTRSRVVFEKIRGGMKMSRSVHTLAVAMVIGMLIGWFGSGATGAPVGQPTPSEQSNMDKLTATVSDLRTRVALLEEQLQILRKEFPSHTHEIQNIGFGRGPHYVPELYYVWTHPGGPRLTGPKKMN